MVLNSLTETGGTPSQATICLALALVVEQVSVTCHVQGCMSVVVTAPRMMTQRYLVLHQELLPWLKAQWQAAVPANTATS